MSQESNATPKKRGRPPSAAAQRRALAAAHEILMAEGFGRMTIEAVAARSGVGKPTIYRSWANAQELAMAALLVNRLPEAEVGGGTAQAALGAQMSGLVTAFASTRGRQITMALAAADPESEFTKAFRNQVILSSRNAGRVILEEALARGEIVPPLDMEALLDMIYGPVFFRLLVGHRPVSPEFGDAIVRTALRAVAPSDA
ncbi:TetR/AcrR family transcriptional regulator [Rhizobium ruizarguesonis]|uniref:TetR/AcrR family transcriptional regulator n=1 Tax=Rhizobium ruizarguesonis TaxID=2081791 RepID=A0ABY1X5M0_9HYPH|nr:TetR/AcrR family transcriptional regulator [Rhizobium ruizarguesonis]TAU67175.1 TetR/AcrR family transcriptional regulator [Rhizobium ruizarguesonis]TAU75451.1 TetR/AcrR family transcriptional regulator [Rhizobium ruizarguesonis]TAV31791.1 TetR/AcrR family transcriptional regulator [Rhizobium ruizarguesonis]TAV36555.1 TetR/AcrR family transcriptional regulator [Rhizobium ruizarguesonis]TAW63723.1 TetR/AcrR family transcriptional regulator [Rhizobium ruizarguesonis]